MRRTTRSCSLLAVACIAGACAVTTAGAPASTSTWSVDHQATYRIAHETGESSINHTGSRWNIYGTDLGHMFTYHGRTYMTFGDTFGPPAANPFFSKPHSDWRSNTMAYSSDRDPSDGLTFDGMITDRPGHAKELLPSLKNPGVEQTVIPTYGVAVGDRMFLHYMSVKRFGEPGRWTLNYSGLAYSDDGGHTWVKDTPVKWPGDSNFGQVAFVKRGPYVYLFGIPGGRYGGVQLARVPRTHILDPGAYRYWDGSAWMHDSSAATTVIPAPVGELSVRWNSHYHTWLMMYLDDPDGKVVVRTADKLTGSWSDPRVVVTAKDYPSLYAPYLTPRWNNGRDIYFTMSQFGRYDVSLMHTALRGFGRHP
ncbi:MAG: DUF4185 domain-containing protein [Streptosporangiales bacterium]